MLLTFKFSSTATTMPHNRSSVSSGDLPCNKQEVKKRKGNSTSGKNVKRARYFSTEESDELWKRYSLISKKLS